jgi:hypothetical protein
MAYAVQTHLPLVQVPPGGTWGSGGSPAHVTAASWLGRPLAGDENPRALIRRYLAAFGPATVLDMQEWSGLIGLRAVINEMRPELRILHDERGRELFDLPEAPLPPAGTAAPPRFLPEYDNLLLAHADRTRVIADEHRDNVILAAGRVKATFLIDGFVAGTWWVLREARRVKLEIEPFAPLAPAAQAAAVEEGGRMLRWMEGVAAAPAAGE